MNQQCKVCGEPAAGFHFGAFTCEGCKSFFGRTYNNLGSISECKNGGVCVINKKNRTACKACRLRKCLMVGMSKSGSRYGRRSNWFKIHCLLQEQSSNSQSAGGLGASHFGPGFLPAFLPSLQSQSQQALGLYAGGKEREQGSPSQEDLAIQSHLLQVAMMKQKQQAREAREAREVREAREARQLGDKSPRPDELALQSQLKLLAWQKEEDRAAQQQASPPRNGSPPGSFSYKDSLKDSFKDSYKELVSSSSMFSMSFASPKESSAASSSLEVFRPFLPILKRATETPSDSGASSVESEEHDESRSNSAFSYFKQDASPPAGEREFAASCAPRRKINATVTLTTDYLPGLSGLSGLSALSGLSGLSALPAQLHHGHGLVYPPAELVTPATSHHSLRGGDLLLASPSPGGLAVEQMEPIDLSVRPAKGFGPGSQQPREPKAQPDREESQSGLPTQEAAAKSNPLDLSVDVKRPAEVS